MISIFYHKILSGREALGGRQHAGPDQERQLGLLQLSGSDPLQTPEAGHLL